MPSDSGAVEIVVCYGTSCFARGNSENLDLLNAYVQRPGINASVRLTGKLCQGECMDGPNLSICGKLYHGVTAERLRDLLQQLGSPLGVDHGTA
jgi:NADH:ubiquinone oxidoreductase subunit E